MKQNRREFLKSSAATASIAALVPSLLRAAGDEKPKRQLSILILGGTGLIGPKLTEAALARGYKVAFFNRGKTRPELFPEVEKIIGNRDPSVGEGVKALQGRSFDVVFDDSGQYPGDVKASAEALAPNIGHYVYVSSISCYKDNSKENADETAECAVLADPTVHTMGTRYENYGGLKALCEQAAEKACPGKTTVVRPGYIVGPGDYSDRYTYWPLRVEKGGEVLAPGAPTDPIQIIDVRDLAEWMLLLAENKTFGVFNACGPEKRLTMGEVLESAKRVTKSDATFTWVDGKFLAENGENGEGSLPIWAPYDGEMKGFHTWSNARAVKAGLKFRDIDVICADTLKWFHSLPAERQQKLRAGISAEQEKAILDKWKAKG